MNEPHPPYLFWNPLRRAALGLLLGVLTWRILVVGLADYYADQRTPDAAVAALRWRPNHPAALYQRAETMIEKAPAVASSLLQASIWGDPTDGLAYFALADLWVAADRRPEALALAEIADLLGPMRIPALARSANFWFTQDRPDLGLQRWSALLRNRPASTAELFPRLLAFAEDPATRPLLQPFLDRPPDWWGRFFAHAARQEPRVETVIFLYQARNRGQDLPTADEQGVYLDRLWKEGRWREAYLAWLEGLDEPARRGLGHLYNGSFDLPITGIGFDWRIKPPPGVTVETVQTYGTHGRRALHVAFDGRPARFRHVLQPLFLDPGRYRLQGRVRPDGLSPGDGLRWMVGCDWPEPRPLAMTEPFIGRDDWQVFGLDFEVPATDCPLQVLRLEHGERVGSGPDGQGGVWFDDLAISRRG
ncbi:tetratricopeptide repeat protein [Candidatus Thiodictyon syntrophicum]|jgi:hypothetical protein|uniref:Uncharacterized protein n=1 Tax=Candidatus Thiodictyon syntrophicum TaxID=1166950 RepID=A0A2K8UE86_9GAMM|nr:hypothetical protein [Candidatus Thiodictyon syntrophicum]AUB83914.1 hypothetical protein THSYN_25270 [Candidatus Thiodictyon syntrophicum]